MKNIIFIILLILLCPSYTHARSPDFFPGYSADYYLSDKKINNKYSKEAYVCFRDIGYYDCRIVTIHKIQQLDNCKLNECTEEKIAALYYIMQYYILTYKIMETKRKKGIILSYEDFKFIDESEVLLNEIFKKLSLKSENDKNIVMNETIKNIFNKYGKKENFDERLKEIDR